MSINYLKAAEISAEYQQKTRALLTEYRDKMVAAFGNAFNSSGYEDFDISPLFFATAEEAIECGFKHKFDDEDCGSYYGKRISDVRMSIVDGRTGTMPMRRSRNDV